MLWPRHVVAGLAFTSDTVGYSGGASNGVGPQIFKTTNGAFALPFRIGGISWLWTAVECCVPCCCVAVWDQAVCTGRRAQPNLAWICCCWTRMPRRTWVAAQCLGMVSRGLIVCPRLQSVVVSSIFGELYSDDAGQSFKPSTGGGTSQSVRYIGVNGDGGLKFGVTGQYGAVNGERFMLGERVDNSA
jgi:hypothetical protein